MNKRIKFDSTLVYAKPINNLLVPKGYKEFEQLINNIKSKNENR